MDWLSNHFWQLFGGVTDKMIAAAVQWAIRNLMMERYSEALRVVLQYVA
jgi:hypothetical protein